MKKTRRQIRREVQAARFCYGLGVENAIKNFGTDACTLLQKGNEKFIENVAKLLLRYGKRIVDGEQVQYCPFKTAKETAEKYARKVETWKATMMTWFNRNKPEIENQKSYIEAHHEFFTEPGEQPDDLSEYIKECEAKPEPEAESKEEPTVEQPEKRRPGRPRKNPLPVTA